MNNQDHLNSAILNGVKFNPFHLQQTVDKKPETQVDDVEQAEQKEIIRRLRIQNKKLLEQVDALKQQVNQSKSNTRRAAHMVDELAKLNKLMSGTLRECRKFLSDKNHK